MVTNNENKAFIERLNARMPRLQALYYDLYGHRQDANLQFQALQTVLENYFLNRSKALKDRDQQKGEGWFLSNKIAGMSLYVDRFCGNLKSLPQKLPYLKELGVNLLHLMPLMESPIHESDGGYAVSNFRKVAPQFGSNEDLELLQHKMSNEGMYLMLDIVLNHTSDKHEWAINARNGDKEFQDFYYFFDNRDIPNEFEKHLPEIFPESSPGNFTFIPEANKWVMTVFHHYQWDLNYRNPKVLIQMLENMLYYANLGVDILRIDAPAFIWKEMGTSCQNLPKAHTILRLLKQCVQVVAPGMAILGEAIVSPQEIMKYFGEGDYIAQECDVAYNATQMALQWDALATSDTTIMQAAQPLLSQKPLGTTWINYTRCHDDIGLGYTDEMIAVAGYNPYEHRKFIKDYYAGFHHYSDAKGALFSVNSKTNDARISGSLASLCGLEQAIDHDDEVHIETALGRMQLMQAMTMMLGGVPMLFYGDEAAYINDYRYKDDAGKSYDNRWMHRPIMDWNKNARVKIKGTIEHKMYEATRKLLEIRGMFEVFSDFKNIEWLHTNNIHVAAFTRKYGGETMFCLFNFSNKEAFVEWGAFLDALPNANTLYDHWQGGTYHVKSRYEYLIMYPYQIFILEAK